MAAAALLELRRLSVAGRGAVPRLEGVNLVIEAGERVALLGPSGAGKSTLLTVANGLLAPTSGEVLWQGAPPARSRRARRRQQARIGTLWQDLRLIEELSVQQNLNAGRLAAWGWPRALLNLLLPLDTAANAAVLARVDLAPELLGQPVAALSGGQRQRVAIARLLRQDPTLLLADEPLASLDPRLAASLLALLLAEATPPRALLLSLHRPDLLAGFDRAIGLRAGRLVFDATPADLQGPAGVALLQELYRGEDRPTDGQIDGQTAGQTDGQINGQAVGQIAGQIDGQTAGQTDGQINGQIDGQINGQAVGQIDGQTDGQINVQTDGHIDGQTDGQAAGQTAGARDGTGDGEPGEPARPAGAGPGSAAAER